MVENIITKCNGSNKVVDFRCKLNPACKEQYASLHQVGGKNPNGQTMFPSLIEMVICDYSKGTGGASKTVSVNIEPHIFYEWLKVCEGNIGNYVIPLKDTVYKEGSYTEKIAISNALNEIRVGALKSTNISQTLSSLITSATQILRKKASSENQNVDLEAIKTLGNGLLSAKSELQAETGDKHTIIVPRHLDYTHTQDKVNIYKKGADGYAPVSRLTVSHRSYDDNGIAVGYAWNLKISNGEAVVLEKGSGATTFNSKTLRNENVAFIRVSDKDMFRMMTRIVRFIENWESAMCLESIIYGEQNRVNEREQFLSR